MPHDPCCDTGLHTPERAAGLNMLDSRAIGRASCYAQRFMRPGSYAYAVVPGYAQAIASDHPFVVDVSDEKADKMAQHDVLVIQSEKGFDVDQRQISIRTGDLVLWSGQGRTSSAFAVVGEHEFLNSHRMVNECGYSHAFGSAGEYRWVDAHGSGLSGTIAVSDPKPGDRNAFARWQKQLHQGNIVMIADGRAEPADLKILVGQTVFFAVVTSGGISITDSRLIEIGGKPGKGGKAAPEAAS